VRTVERTRKRFAEDGLEAALSAPRPERRKLVASEEALLIATACSEPPDDRDRWTMRLLSARMEALTPHDVVSRELVRRTLKNTLKPWQTQMCCLPAIDVTFISRIETLLDLYAEPRGSERPVVCIDEKPVQLIGEARPGCPGRPGRPKQIDYQYRRLES
jgi:hypothetical protein